METLTFKPSLPKFTQEPWCRGLPTADPPSSVPLDSRSFAWRRDLCCWGPYSITSHVRSLTCSLQVHIYLYIRPHLGSSSSSKLGWEGQCSEVPSKQEEGREPCLDHEGELESGQGQATLSVWGNPARPGKNSFWKVKEGKMRTRLLNHLTLCDPVAWRPHCQQLCPALPAVAFTCLQKLVLFQLSSRIWVTDTPTHTWQVLA